MVIEDNKPVSFLQSLRSSSFRLMHPPIPLMSGMHNKVSDHHGVMATEQTCQRITVAEVQLFQIDASTNSVDVWNAQQ
jgi:hypothetical protein